MFAELLRSLRQLHCGAVLLLCLSAPTVFGASSPEWVRAVSRGGSGSDHGNAVKVDVAGNYYVAGHFSASARFSGKTLAAAGGTDAFLAKYAADGKLKWVLKAGGLHDDVAYDLALDSARNIYVTGYFVDTAVFFSANGTSRTVTGSGEMVFLAKYDRTGTLQWLQTASAFGNNRGHGIAVVRETGEVYLTGFSQGDMNFSSSDGVSHSLPGPWTWHMFLAKYDQYGKFQWGQYTSASPNIMGMAVAADAVGNAYVTGWLEGISFFSSRDGNHRSVSGLSEPVQSYPDYPGDIFVAKYDGYGNVKWINQIGGYKANPTEIAVSRTGRRISVTGFIGNIDYGTPEQAHTLVTSQPGGATVDLGGGSFTAPYNADAVLATYDNKGILIKASRIGGTGHDVGAGVAYGGDSSLFLSGSFQGTVDVGGTLLTGDKANNLFVLKYASNGQLAWTKTAAGAASAPISAEVGDLCVYPATAGASERVFAVGGYRDEAVFGATSLHASGDEDIFIAELH